MRSFQNFYLHVPFCSGKCDYCAFYSEPELNTSLVQQWADRISEQIEKLKRQDEAFHTVYLGGGTPSLLSEEVLKRIFEQIHELPLAEDCEISMEANPFTVTPEKAKVMTRYVNRVSLGVQSFHAETLTMLGRRSHEGPTPEEAVRNLREAGLGNLGLDLIYGVPNQTLEQWIGDLEQALALHPEHISAYSVVPEPGTAFAKRTDEMETDDALQQTMWEETERILSKHGIFRYEISNYAKPGFHSRHNFNVWMGESYLGTGPSAVSFDGHDRRMEPADLYRWLNGEEATIDRISAEARAAEILMMGLRTVSGWNAEVFRKAAGMSWDFLSGELEELEEDGLIRRTKDKLYATEKGLTYWNIIGETLVRA